MLKKFAVFAGYAYYPDCGWRDFVAAFESEAQALDCANEQFPGKDWFQVVDLEEHYILHFEWKES